MNGQRVRTNDRGNAGPERLVAAEVLVREAGEVAAEWRELCRWNPELAPDTVPPAVEPVIEAVAGALNRPQPIGLGPDVEVAAAVDAFTDLAGAEAVEELVCLREALSRRLRGKLPASEAEETWARLQVTLDRAISCATRRAFAQLERAASFDTLTGVMNRRSFEVDVNRELGRIARHGGCLSLAVLDLDGLKVINDTLGHTTGDARLQALGAALRGSIRREDTAYRLGGDEFAVLLPGASPAQVRQVMTRVADAAVPSRFTWGAATSPGDGNTPKALVATADARLYRRRARARGVRSAV